MFKKKIKIEIPKEKRCYKCGKIAKVSEQNITHDEVLRVFYKCKCGNVDCWLKNIKFV